MLIVLWSRSSGRQAARLFSMPHLVQQETTLAYLESQIAAALTLQSSHEYRHWLLIYARYLVNEGETCHAVLTLCSSDGFLRNALFMSCLCTTALNVLLLALGFLTWCLLKSKTNCWSASTSYSAQYSDTQTVNRLWSGETVPSVDLDSRNCTVEKSCVCQAYRTYCLAAATGVPGQSATPCKIGDIPQPADYRCLMRKGRVAHSDTVPEHVKPQRICLCYLHFILFLHSLISTACIGELHRLNSMREETYKKGCLCILYLNIYNLCNHIK